MTELLTKLQAKFPKLQFTPLDKFYWSPETREIFYKSSAHGQKAQWSLLHETGHALLDHTNYQADVELLRLEVEAWERAKQIGRDFGVEIDEDHIQDCLDTYRDWLHKRSICPTCHTRSLQQGDFVHYRCFNCHTVWRVGTSRFNRAYRQTKSSQKHAVTI